MATYTGVATATQPPDSGAAPGHAVQISIPAGTDAPTIESISQQMKVGADYLTALFGPYYAPGYLGDGSDGNVVLDGTNTFSWATKVGNVYTNNRPVQVKNATVTGAGVQWKAGGYPIFGQGTLTTIGGATVNADGTAAATFSAIAAVTAGTVFGNAASGAGIVTGGSGAGGNGGATTASLGGSGGAGGASGGAGGTGGVATPLTTNQGNARQYSIATFGHVLGVTAGASLWTMLQGGGGGGGGGAAASGQAGAGGGGGGALCLAFRTLALATATDISAKGGAGLAGTATNAGGGGGGGGGLVILVYGSKNAVTFSSAVNCAGGALGAGAGTGAAGVVGSAGTFIEIALA